MSALFDSSRFVGFPKNRYEALDEVQSFLEFNGVDLGQTFDVLSNSNDGYLIYSFGDAQIQFTRGFELGNRNAIQLWIELENEKMKKSVEYEYEIKDLKLLKKKRQFGMTNSPRY
jgi:hypothetical protein